LSVRVDPESEVSEQSEGNNAARFSVIVQDADFYLSEAYFSPDGDGIQDRTILAYRATVPVDVIVSNSRGQAIRTLAKHAPMEGSVEWDGRNDLGGLAPDGAYTFNLVSANGAALGRATVILDLNRVSLHYASRSQPLASQNLTCHLPGGTGNALAWLPNGEEMLAILRSPTNPDGVDLLRYTHAFAFANPNPVLRLARGIDRNFKSRAKKEFSKYNVARVLLAELAKPR
jgi:hypothetical protein